MWRIEEASGELIPAEVVLDAGVFGEGHPNGQPSREEKGFSFFMEVDGKLEYITSRISDKPVLIAVTEEQFKNWKKKKIFAQPAKFIWKV